jgi:hypothetical protein
MGQNIKLNKKMCTSLKRKMLNYQQKKEKKNAHIKNFNWFFQKRPEINYELLI